MEGIVSHEECKTSNRMSKHLFQVLDELWEVFASMEFHRLPEFKSPKSVKTERVFFKFLSDPEYETSSKTR